MPRLAFQLPRSLFLPHLLHEFRHFRSYPRNMRVLLLTNMLYAFVLPVLNVFVAAYVMGKSKDVRLVVAYQLAVYVGIPLMFYVNGFLLQHANVKRLYSLGMMLSGAAVAALMTLGTLDLAGVAAVGLLLGLAAGVVWANRGYLVLSVTDDANRNYYYGVENFFYMITSVLVPLAAGWFIVAAQEQSWLGASRDQAYYALAAAVCLLTVLASLVVHRGQFANPPPTAFIYFRFHPLWNRFQLLAVLKGLAQGSIVTAPAMLILAVAKGQEGALGTAQAIGGAVSAFVLYGLGRLARPGHRLGIFALGLALFALGGLLNAILFNAPGVWLYMICQLAACPLLDFAYCPIEMRVIETVAALEKRNQLAYLCNHELGLFLGRAAGCGLFLFLTAAMPGQVPGEFALRYALLVIGAVQLLSVPVAGAILKTIAALAAAGQAAHEPAAIVPAAAEGGLEELAYELKPGAQATPSP
jgi:YQGE family putative transporter